MKQNIEHYTKEPETTLKGILEEMAGGKFLISVVDDTYKEIGIPAGAMVTFIEKGQGAPGTGDIIFIETDKIKGFYRCYELEHCHAWALIRSDHEEAAPLLPVDILRKGLDNGEIKIVQYVISLP